MREAEARWATEKQAELSRLQAERDQFESERDQYKDDFEDTKDELIPTRALLGYTQTRAQALCTLGTVGIKAFRMHAGEKGKRGPSDAQLMAHETAMLKVKEVSPAKNVDGLSPLVQIHDVMREFLDAQSEATIDLVRAEECAGDHGPRQAMIEKILNIYV